MTFTSLLTKEAVDSYLRVARQNLERDGFLEPTIFVHTAGNKRLIIPLSPPDTSESRTQLFAEIGRYLHKEAMQPTEALFLFESWFVDAQKVPAAMGFPPSEHPSREEAIIAIGQRADNSRYTEVVQPFTKDKENRLVWQASPIAIYDEKTSPDNGPVGLLDYLFAAISVPA